MAVAYDHCGMEIAKTQRMTGMEDCAGMDMPEPNPEKKTCCVDLACSKCFSIPLQAMKPQALIPWSWHDALSLQTSYKRPSYSTSAPERPPKMA